MSGRSHYQFCVSGAAKGDSVEQGRKLVEDAAEAIAKAGHSLMTGATTGLPEIAAKSYVKAGGKVSLGISPASSKIEHVLKYHLPTDAYDVILAADGARCTNSPLLWRHKLRSDFCKEPEEPARKSKNYSTFCRWRTGNL
jgi:hypothetical protein